MARARRGDAVTMLPLSFVGALSGLLCGLLWALPPDVPPPQRDPSASGAAQKAPQPKIKRDAQRRNRKTS